MASNNNTKNIILQLFADNAVGNISAETIRNFINSIFDDSEVIINKFDTLDNFELQDNITVYEGSIVAITNTVDSEQGLYISTINQPKERKFLNQLSSNIKEVSSVKSSLELIANTGQNIFNVVYTDNLIDLYVDGSKISASKVQLNSQIGVNGTNITLIYPYVLQGGEEVEIISIVKQS